MARCHWHPDRDAAARCELCRKPMCFACSTQLAEPPESYRLCPECLASLERLVDRGLVVQTQNVSQMRAWLGAVMGGLFALVLWLVVISLISPSWYSFVRWVGYVSCGLITALLALWFTGSRRGRTVAVATIVVTMLAIVLGHYLSANVQFTSYLAANSEATEALVRAGVMQADHGWWLPKSLVLRASWGIMGWKDAAVIVSALYVAYAFTRRGRVWQSHRNRPLAAGDAGATASG